MSGSFLSDVKAFYDLAARDLDPLAHFEQVTSLPH